MTVSHGADKGITDLARCSQLESVDLSWCIGVTDQGICTLAKSCRKLALLSLHGLRGITDISIDAMAEYCSGSLQTLDVHGCLGVLRSTREELVAKLPNLTRFLVHT